MPALSASKNDELRAWQNERLARGTLGAGRVLLHPDDLKLRVGLHVPRNEHDTAALPLPELMIRQEEAAAREAAAAHTAGPHELQGHGRPLIAVGARGRF